MTKKPAVNTPPPGGIHPPGAGNTAWGGRFGEAPSDAMARFGASVDVDQRLAAEDIRGSIAHVRMLEAQKIIGSEDAQLIVAGLQQIDRDITAGQMQWQPALEDVHMNIESALTEHIGAAGGRLHTARSRNDQVATDMRMWTRDACGATASHLDRLMTVIWARANESLDLLMPGYTHLQRAQPVRLSHHLLAWVEMLDRDRGRLLDAARRMNECPLGAGALATTTFPIDRHATATALGFSRPTQNSLDTVADRDFLVESVSALANCAVHLSRIAEEIVLWCSQEFAFMELSDAFATGSSMMPQKKNPDVAELVRGKTGRVVGDLVSLLMMLKGLPLTYNRDMQEDKTPTFDAFDTVNASVEVLAGALATARFRAERLRQALSQGFVTATELADYLAERGVPFREAHGITGRLVRLAIDAGKGLEALTLEELRKEHVAFTDDVFATLDPEMAVERRDVIGGPSRNQVGAQLRRWSEELRARGIDLDVVSGDYGWRAAPGA